MNKKLQEIYLKKKKISSKTVNEKYIKTDSNLYFEVRDKIIKGVRNCGAKHRN